MENQEGLPSEQKKERSWLARMWGAISVPLVSVLLALLIGAIILLVSGANPITAYKALMNGAFSGDGLGRTLEKATPLLFSGLAVSFAFKAGLFNIGAQGQLLFGAIVAAGVGFGIEGLPPAIHIPLALLAGAAAGGLFAAIPGILRTTTGAHEVITTIMLNYVAINITDYLADGPWKDPTPGNVVARTPAIFDSAVIPRIGNLPLGFFIALVFAAIVWWLLNKTTLGFEIRTAGMNQRAAKYAGIKVARTIVLTMILSGLLAGLGGAIETQGVVGRYQPGFNVGLGFDGITVALLGKTNPFGNILAALLVGAMKAGSSRMQFDAGVAAEITNVIQAMMLFFVAADVIVRWIIRSRDDDEGGISLTSGWGSN
ncbi:MAG TPA: ABC transporter permease [Anaerolineales bacterium]|nr:ABC transporter permease [Anaerolineales bacterium]